MSIPQSLRALSEQFKKFPGVGDKTAMRYVLFLMKHSDDFAEELVSAITNAKKQTTFCSVCFNYASNDQCELCTNPRDGTMLCVVADTRDLEAIEGSGEFKGCYHVLHGLISPMEGIGPADLKIKELFQRLQKEDIQEVILAFDSSVEGEATALYISRFLKTAGIKVTRLVFGLAIGVALENADPLSMGHAIKGRVEI